MRTIEEVIEGRDLNSDEFLIINNFWNKIREIQGRRDESGSKNRNLVGAALGSRRIAKREIDIETMGSLTGLARSSLQITLQQMIDDGMIYFDKDPSDLRRQIIKPTEKFLALSLDMYEETRQLVLATCKELEAIAKQK
ncbi:MAG: MarR family winged helix-turn-helix transcriptional regulator [Proteobacteria bacterium]|nr:MarR family winged helix-turn-helix transcriptional regulator [Pseudomonadota bacterium]